MNPLFRATAATLALAGFSDGTSSSNVAEAQHHIVDFAQRHLGNEEYSIGAKSSAKKTRILSDDYVPPWSDNTPPWSDNVVATTNPPTGQPTNRPTTPPTAPPTNVPTNVPTPGPTQPLIPAAPTIPPTEGPPTDPPTNAPVAPTSSPTKSPVVEVVDGAITTLTTNKVQQTSCTYLPEIGNFVSETLDIEYFLYLNDEFGLIEDGSLQGIVDSFIEPMFHVALVDSGLSCLGADFATASHVMVEVSSSGRDLLGAECTIDDDLLLGNATECYTVWGQVEATMWFPPRRFRKLQTASGTTPFGDREAFNEFTDVLEEALASLSGISISGSEAEVVKASFKGFVNLNSFDGTNTDLTKDNLGGVNIAAALQDSGLSADDGGIDLGWGLVAIVGGTLVLFSAIVVMVLRRKRRGKAFREHVRVVEDLALDSKDDLDNNADYVDDDSLFKEDKPLPKEFQVKLESADHDYRWIGEERQGSPIFVATERNKEFHDHLATLKRKKEQEIRERQYESAML